MEEVERPGSRMTRFSVWFASIYGYIQGYTGICMGLIYGYTGTYRLVHGHLGVQLAFHGFRVWAVGFRDMSVYMACLWPAGYERME